MRDLHLSGTGKKQHLPELNLVATTALVRQQWPGAYAEGCVGAYSWYLKEGGLVVAEAWMHARRGWWLRIRVAG